MILIAQYSKSLKDCLGENLRHVKCKKKKKIFKFPDHPNLSEFWLRVYIKSDGSFYPSPAARRPLPVMVTEPWASCCSTGLRTRQL